MKKLLIILSAICIVSTALTGCAMNNKDTSTTNDQTLTPTSSMSEKVSEDLTDASEKVSEALTDASENMTDNTMEDTTK